MHDATLNAQAPGTTDQLETIKTVALASGVQIGPDVLAWLGGPDSLTVHEYPTTGGITLVLPGEVLVNAAFDEAWCADSPLVLSLVDGHLELRLGDTATPVLGVLPLPGYLASVDACGRLVADVAMSHADRVRVSPIEGCAFNCAFCDMPGRYVPRPLEQILAALDVALRDDALPARHVLISGGSPGQASAQQDYFRDVCVGVLRHARSMRNRDGRHLEVDIMMSARADARAFVETMVEEGVHGFSFNVEAYSEAGAQAHLARKHKLTRPHLQPMIEHAVAALGHGTGRVRSLIIAGLETPEQTLDGVEWLASLGCDPVLSPFRPARGTAMADAAPLEPSVLSHILERSRRIARRHGVAIGPRCVPCQHNTLSFPWDVR